MIDIKVSGLLNFRPRRRTFLTSPLPYLGLDTRGAQELRILYNSINIKLIETFLECADRAVD